MDIQQFTQRQLALMPPWFGEDPQNLIATLQGSAYCNNNIYSLLFFLKAQMRLQDMQGESLDLFAQDFFGENLLRHYAEDDNSYRKRISAALLRPGATRQAMIDVLTDLTGRVPVIWESGIDSGFCDYFFCDHFSVGGTAPAQAWIIAYRPFNPETAGIFYVDNTAYCDNFYASGDYTSTITDQDILSAIEETKAQGTVMHTILLD